MKIIVFRAKTLLIICLIIGVSAKYALHTCGSIGIFGKQWEITSHLFGTDGGKKGCHRNKLCLG